MNEFKGSIFRCADIINGDGVEVHSVGRVDSIKSSEKISSGALHFRTSPGDSPLRSDIESGRERSEIYFPGMETSNLISIETTIVVDPHNDITPKDGEFLIVLQLHGTPDEGEGGGSPTLAIEVDRASGLFRLKSRTSKSEDPTLDKDSLTTSLEYSWEYNDYEPNHIVIDYKDGRGGEGYIRMWLNGELVVDQVKDTGYNNERSVYPKFGIYSKTNEPTEISVHHIGLQVRNDGTSWSTSREKEGENYSQDDHILSGMRSIGESAERVIFNASDSEVVQGTPLNDWVVLGDGVNTFSSLSGDDTVFGGQSRDKIISGDGNDIVYAGEGNDKVYGGNGDDSLFGQEGFDIIHSGAGNDTIYGGAQADNIFGGGGDDVIYGGAGFDRIFGGWGDDYIHDVDGIGGFFGGSGDDTISGGNGVNNVFGGAGNDLILGGGGDDTLRGSAGFDTINGGSGDDILWGNFNADLFIMSFGCDVVMDFSPENPFEVIDVREMIDVKSFLELLENHISEEAGSVVIDDLNGNRMRLEGVTIAELSAGDFLL